MDSLTTEIIQIIDDMVKEGIDGQSPAYTEGYQLATRVAQHRIECAVNDEKSKGGTFTDETGFIDVDGNSYILGDK